MKVKIFNSCDTEKLETKINEWLKEEDPTVRSVQQSFAPKPGGLIITIFYYREEK